MNGELKSKFRDRLKYFKQLFFLKKKNGNNFDLKEENKTNELKNINSFNKVVYKPNVKKIYIRKIGIDDSLNNIKIKKNININFELQKDNNINYNNKDIKKSRIVKIKYVKKRRKVGIDEKNNSKILENSRDDVNNNVFNKIEHIEKNDRELALNTIVGKLNNKSKKMLYKLDNLYSDYYNILNYSEEEIDKDECEKRIKEIEIIKKEIEEISKQFNIINDDKYLDNVLELDDSNLIDDIIKYKRLCSKLIDKKDVYESYKKIENYDRVNSYLDKFSKKIDELKDKKEKKKEEIEQRDKDFDLFKKNVTSVDVKNERYFSMLNSQVDICNYLLKNVEKIFKRESVEYKLKGLGDLVSSSFKYLFYLSISPFKGIFPSIAMHTLATRDMIRYIRNNMELEEIRKVKYYAKDYEYEINKNIYDVNNLNNLLYSTLEDIYNLKSEFKDKYGKYINKINEYKDIYNKIEKIENTVKFNLDRVKKVEKQLNKSKEKNKDKLIKIKRLNN